MNREHTYIQNVVKICWSTPLKTPTVNISTRFFCSSSFSDLNRAVLGDFRFLYQLDLRIISNRKISKDITDINNRSDDRYSCERKRWPRLIKKEANALTFRTFFTPNSGNSRMAIKKTWRNYVTEKWVMMELTKKFLVDVKGILYCLIRKTDFF